MFILNYIYFFILTYFGLKFLFSGGGTIKSPFDETIKLKLNGPEMFWCLTFSTGLIALSAPGAIDLMALRLMVLEALCFIGLFITKDKPILAFPMGVYAAYICWIIIGCFYSPSPFYGVRVVLKYLYPILICLFASAAVRYCEVFIKSSLLARSIAIVTIIFAFVPFIGNLVPGVFWYGTAGAINYISMMILSLTLFYFTNEKKKNILLALLFILPCFLWVFRTSIVGSFIALFVFFFFKYNLKAIPAMVGIVIVAVSLMFAVPSVREKMFYSPEGKSADMLYEGGISRDDIDSNGRFAMWDWSLKNFYANKELTGTGTGNLQETFYMLRHPFGTIRICHNDYVQILCDNGLIGIILYVGAYFCILFHTFIVYNTKRFPNYIRMAALIAGASLAGVMFTAYTDNAINYTMATFSMPLGFYGMMLGMKHHFEYTA